MNGSARRPVTVVLVVVLVGVAVFAIASYWRQPAAPASTGAPAPPASTSAQASPTGASSPASPTDGPLTPGGILTAHPSRTGAPHGQPARPPGRTDADQVAAAFVAAMTGWDCSVDAVPADASRRAAAFAAPQLGRRLRAAPASLSPAAVAHWNKLVTERGWTIVKTSLGGLGPNPPETATEASRAVTARFVDHDAAGRVLPTAPDQPLYILDLRRSAPGHPWAVASYQVRDGVG